MNTTGTRHADTVELVRLAYGDCQQPPRRCRLLDFRTEGSVDWHEVADCLRAIGTYNAFDPDLVIDKLEPVFGELMYAQVGREGSPVIYATIPYWTHQYIGLHSMRGEPIDEEERRRIGGRFLAAMQDARADELQAIRSLRGRRVHTVRAWWD